jgi:glucose-6-phosphate isomerase
MLYNFQAKQKLNIFFVYNFHNNFLLNLLNKLKNKKFAIIIVSKSGNTLETSIAFDLFKNVLIQNFGAKAHEYILAITDKQKGTLHNLVVKYK